MNLILIIGHRGQGKSTLTRRLIEGARCYVFDVNNEYTDLPDDRVIRPRMRSVELDVKKYLEISKNLRGTNLVFEDATGFFRGRQSQELSRQLVKARHNRNNFIFLFHSINRVPPELMEMSNVVFLFKTVDNADYVERKFRNEALTAAYRKLKTAPKYHYETIKLL